MKFGIGRDNVIRLSSTVRTAQPDASRALEEAWLKRRQELGNWQPSNGWLVDQAVASRRTLTAAR
jgi:hypothetical protein